MAKRQPLNFWMSNESWVRDQPILTQRCPTRERLITWPEITWGLCTQQSLCRHVTSTRCSWKKRRTIWAFVFFYLSAAVTLKVLGWLVLGLPTPASSGEPEAWALICPLLLPHIVLVFMWCLFSTPTVPRSRSQHVRSWTLYPLGTNTVCKHMCYAFRRILSWREFATMIMPMAALFHRVTWQVRLVSGWGSWQNDAWLKNSLNAETQTFKREIWPRVRGGGQHSCGPGGNKSEGGGNIHHGGGGGLIDQRSREAWTTVCSNTTSHLESKDAK